MSLNSPKAAKKDKVFLEHGVKRTDPFYWLNERENPEVKDLLEAENKYLEDSLAHTRDFQATLYEEMKGRIKEQDESVPYRKDGFWFYHSFEEGDEYPRLFRSSTEAKNGNLILDLNTRAKGSEYYDLGAASFAPDFDLFAISEDKIGRRNYDIQFLRLSNSEATPEVIENTTGSLAWSACGNFIFYTKKDDVTLRPYLVYRHKLGTSSSEDVLVYEEKDEAFHIDVYRSKSKSYIIIGCYSTLTTDFKIIPSDEPESVFQDFKERKDGVEYYPAHAQDKWVIKTNEDAPNFKLDLYTDEKGLGAFEKTIVAHDKATYIEDVELFSDLFAVQTRHKGLCSITIYDYKTLAQRKVEFNEETYTLGFGTNTDFDFDQLRIFFSSLTTPSSTIDIDLNTLGKTVKKEQEVLGAFNKDDYTSKRIWVKAHDGKEIAVSMVSHKNTSFENAPTLLYAYGSYGHTVDPYFSSNRLSLLNRGFIFAIAHIRGGSYLGKQWYDEGKMFAKKNTFLDFISCGEHLVQSGITQADNLYAMGGSAGGLLMGVIANYRPTLFKGIVNQVGFLDVMTTMMDDSIPLTTGEYDEWGNPNNKDSYLYMLSYSPYDNISKLPYPTTLLTTGFHDSQVQYWEPAKYAQKLRMYSESHNPIYLHTNFGAGHGGSSGRFEYLKEIALEYVFLFDLAEIKK